MDSVRRKRGRLPQRVYWVRRGVVLVVALLLVFGIGKLFGGTGSDDPGATVKAKTSSAQQAPGASASIGPVAPSTKLSAQAEAPLLPPEGDCLDDEVSVLPSVKHAWAGGPITIELALQGTQPACNFAVSPTSLVVKVVSGQDRIWSSQDCPKAIPTTQVVVRSGTPVAVPVRWNGRRSDDGCTHAPAWAMPGFYHVYAAALGSTPRDVQFEITRGPTVRVTRTPKPSPSASASPRAHVKASASAAAEAKAKATPTKKPASKVSGKESKCGGDNAAGSC